MKANPVTVNKAFPSGMGGIVCGLSTSTSNPPPPPPPPPSSGKCRKRGLAYTFPSSSDMSAVANKITWWYNWGAQPAPAEQNYGQYGVEYVPMVWGAASIQNGPAVVPTTSKYVLGFNEPNFVAQANLAANQAAALWPKVQQTAIRASPTATPGAVSIVSPAVNYCGSPCQDTDPFHYLDSFFAACGNCEVDYIAAHWYGCTADSLKNYLNGLRKYKKPVWITEFSCAQWDGSWQNNQQFQIDYMTQAVSILENDPMVFRYAWFSGRTSEIPYVNIFGDTGQLTQLGNAYMNQPCGSGPFTALGDSSSSYSPDSSSSSLSTPVIIGLSVAGFVVVVVAIVIVAIVVAMTRKSSTEEKV